MFVNILVTIKVVIPPLFMVVKIPLSLQTKVVCSPSRFCPLSEVSHSILGFVVAIVPTFVMGSCAFVLPLR